MRTAKSHVRYHGEKGLKLIADESVPLREQAESFKKLRISPANDKIAEAHYQESDGHLRIARFLTPAELKARNDANAKAEQESAKHAEAQGKKEAPKAPAKPTPPKAVPSKQ